MAKDSQLATFSHAESSFVFHYMLFFSLQADSSLGFVYFFPSLLSSPLSPLSSSFISFSTSSSSLSLSLFYMLPFVALMKVLNKKIQYLLAMLLITVISMVI